jgi:hypothetical protein
MNKRSSFERHKADFPLDATEGGSALNFTCDAVAPEKPPNHVPAMAIWSCCLEISSSTCNSNRPATSIRKHWRHCAAHSTIESSEAAGNPIDIFVAIEEDLQARMAAPVEHWKQLMIALEFTQVKLPLALMAVAVVRVVESAFGVPRRQQSQGRAPNERHC